MSTSGTSGSGKVNPITYLARRLSKTLSLNRGSITQESEDLPEYSHKPHVRLPTSLRARSARSTERAERSDRLTKSQTDSPAPLASADCFDITDSSDIEGNSKPTMVKTEDPSDGSSMTPVASPDSEAESESLCNPHYPADLGTLSWTCSQKKRG